MPDFVYDLPLDTLATYIFLVSILAVVVGLLVVKPVLRLLIGGGADLNEAISYGTGSFSLFYGLLLGLLTVSAYQNADRVSQAILGEATAISALYSDMNVYPEPIRSDMKAMMRDYVLFTIHKDWPAHRRSTFLDGGENRTNAMRLKLASFEPETPGQEVVHAQVLGDFQRFTEARQQRLTGIYTRIPDVLWYAVLVGAGVTILLICLLRMRPVRQFVLCGISSFFLGVILFVIISLDDPLRGEAGQDPTPIVAIWDRTMIWDEPQY